jgi:hypothetical protein
MTSQKVGASQPNTRAASFENAVSVSNSLPRPSLTGGGGSTSKNSESSKLVGTPPPIKRQDDFCSKEKPCGELWRTHSDPIALRLHLGHLWKVSWPALRRINRQYGVDHMIQAMHDTKEFARQELKRGKEVDVKGGALARIFCWLLPSTFESEPELLPDIAEEVDQTISDGLDSLRVKKIHPDFERDKYLLEYQRRRG